MCMGIVKGEPLRDDAHGDEAAADSRGRSRPSERKPGELLDQR